MTSAAIESLFVPATPTTARARGNQSSPGWWLMLLEGRALSEAAATLFAWPLLQLAPRGDGHTVMVLPGLGADDYSTLLLRRYLTDRGYKAVGWGQGLNRGDRAEARQALAERLAALEEDSGKKVSLVGWSMGGVFARMLANQFPDKVRRVVTLGTPFTGDEKGTNAGWAYRLLNGKSPRGLKSSQLGRAATAFASVPTTSIFSRTDGIVSWHNSFASVEDPLSENVEVYASHIGLGAHPAALYAVAERLASPIDGTQWKRFEAPLLLRPHFPDPARN